MIDGYAVLAEELRDCIGKQVRVVSEAYPDYPAEGKLWSVGPDEVMGMGGFCVEVRLDHYRSRIIPLYRITCFEVLQ